MELVDSLSTIVEFSIGLAGFTGIIAIFSQSKGRVSKAFKFRVTNLLVLSFAPGFIGLLIIGISQLGFSTELGVRLGSLLIAALSIRLMARAVTSRRAMSVEEKQQLSSFVWNISIWGSMLNIIAQLSTLVLADSIIGGVLMLGLIFILLIAAFSFSGIVLQLLDGNAEAE